MIIHQDSAILLADKIEKLIKYLLPVLFVGALVGAGSYFLLKRLKSRGNSFSWILSAPTKETGAELTNLYVSKLGRERPGIRCC